MTAERIDLDHLYALAEGATAGPWCVEDPMAPETLWVVQVGKATYEWWPIAVCTMPDEEDHEFTAGEVHANAAYIAALSPDVVKGLIERVRRAEALVSEAAEEIESWGAYAGEFFQQKHDLAGTVARFRTALEAKDE